MITFSHTSPEQDIYAAQWTATFGNHRPALTGSITGNLDYLRWRLRAEYRGHVLYIADQLCAIECDNARAIDARAVFVSELQKNLMADHVTLAREMQHVPIYGMLPSKPSQGREMAYSLSILWANVLEDIATSKKSLWVRGALEQLDGTIIEPWKDGQLTKAA